MSNRQFVDVDGWPFGLQYPNQPGPYPVILMLHGWTGDENAMWVFAPRLPQEALIIAPRGLNTTPFGGYGWHAHQPKGWPWVDDFKPAIEVLREVLTPSNFPEGLFSEFQVVGFSQGAALAYSMAMLYPAKIGSIAGLSGFLPEGASALARNRPLTGKQIFMAHGSQDDLVPVARARQGVKTLEEAGAQVTYCEDDVGHKLSSTCFSGLEKFFSKVKLIP